MIRAIFGEFCFVSMLARELSISAKRHMLHHMSGFINIFASNIAVASAELKLEAHHCCARHVNKQPTRTIVEPYFCYCVFHLAALFSILALGLFLFAGNVAPMISFGGRGSSFY